MEISIVIPVYNRASLVSRTLMSVYAQTYRPLRVVLVDNNSSDASYSILTRFKEEYDTPDFKVTVCREVQPGAAAARNRGVCEVSGEWVMFFDSDDEMCPQLVSEYVTTINKNTQADIVYTDIKMVDEQGCACVKRSPCGNLLYGHIFHSYLSTQRYIVRRSLLERAGAWNVNLPGWDDWELGVRLLLLSPRVVKVSSQAPLVVVHAHADSITGRRYSDKWEYWERSADEVERVVRASVRNDKNRLLTSLEYKRVMLAASYTREGSDRGEELYRRVIGRLTGRPFARMICAGGYRLMCRGVRGTARVAELLFRMM